MMWNKRHTNSINKIHKYIRAMAINQQKTMPQSLSLFIKTVSHPCKTVLFISLSVVADLIYHHRINHCLESLNEFAFENDHWF